MSANLLEQKECENIVGRSNPRIACREADFRRGIRRKLTGFLAATVNTSLASNLTPLRRFRNRNIKVAEPIISR
jgi:hypothetical protein